MNKQLNSEACFHHSCSEPIISYVFTWWGEGGKERGRDPFFFLQVQSPLERERERSYNAINYKNTASTFYTENHAKIEGVELIKHDHLDHIRIATKYV